MKFIFSLKSLDFFLNKLTTTLNLLLNSMEEALLIEYEVVVQEKLGENPVERLISAIQ